jgi:putative endonuclease
MKSRRQATGNHWEEIAAQLLVAEGLTILYRSYRCRVGELDLICDDGGGLVIVEVRARRSGTYATAAETVDRNKQRKILRAARHLLMTHPEWHDRSLRFDVVAADDIAGAKPRLTWIKNAFSAS